MSADYQAWSAQVRRLHAALVALRPAAAAVGVPPPAGEEWFELLERKLIAQLDAPPSLVVAVVGGTNIGKSAIFNQLAGEEASRSSPLAAGTKHPVCLVPAALADEAILAPMFEGFELRPWHSPDDPLSAADEHLLFWRVGQNTPPRLLLLDTPDIDSDAQVNWQRADHIRQSADVLVGVLTDQKYRDAVVKQFFRAGVAADKPIVLVFNLCDLAGDRAWWPQWLRQFCEETGARPELVYVVPRDRSAAAELRLPFYEVGPEGARPPEEPSSLAAELAALHFDAIKIRTFRGALSGVLDGERGAPGYLRRLRAAAGQFQAAHAALTAAETGYVDWPVVPASVLADEIRGWWNSGRSGWSRSIHGFYRGLGERLTLPVRWAWRKVAPAGVDPLVNFQQRERATVVQAVGKLLDELERLAQVGNETLRPRLQKLLGGDARRRLLEQIQASHAALPPVDDHYRDFLRGELDAWVRDNPRPAGLLRSLDQVAAVARPAITLSLAVSGIWVATHTVMSALTETAIGVGIPAGGEALVDAAGEGVSHAVAALFRRLQTRYAEDRRGWLYAWLGQTLLGELLDELARGGQVPQSAEFQAVESLLARLAAE